LPAYDITTSFKCLKSSLSGIRLGYYPGILTRFEWLVTNGTLFDGCNKKKVFEFDPVFTQKSERKSQ
jgi:hypothetical protein